MGKLQLNCIMCSKEFARYPSQCIPPKGSNKYCSKSCADKARIGIHGKGPKKEWIELTCINCNKEFKVTPCRGNQAKYCSQKCRPIWNKGLNAREDTRIYSGKVHHNWRGGVDHSTERNKLMQRSNYILWRTAVFMRDDYTCQTCLIRGGELNADHIKPWSLYPELRYAIDNGRTLCVSCHRQTDTWGARVYSVERVEG